jgi:O-antigen ligase
LLVSYPNTQDARSRALAGIQRHADTTARASAIALGASIPFTVALNNIFLAITLLAWLSSGHYRQRCAAFVQPVAIVAMALFGVVALATFHGLADTHLALIHLKKYADLAFIPVFLSLFRDNRSRLLALQAFALSLAAILSLSYLLKSGVALALPAIVGNPQYPVVFKEHLTHNILMAFAVFLYAWLAVSAKSAWGKSVWCSLALLALINVTVMVHGATGYLVFGGLLLLLGYRYIGWRGILMSIFVLALIASALMTFSNPFEQRVNKIATEWRQWQPNQPAKTSTGWRLEFYRTTLSVIADQPILGVGTGGFAAAYAKKVEGTGKVATQNPHNEFLLMWAQLGIAGLALLIWLFWWQWRLAADLPTRLESELARGLVVTMVIGCMFNSLLLDHTEGLFYAWLTGVLYGGLKSANFDNDVRGAAHSTPPT